jgi:RNA polymerase sigma-70 factor, ECF subfamily
VRYPRLGRASRVLACLDRALPSPDSLLRGPWCRIQRRFLEHGNFLHTRAPLARSLLRLDGMSLPRQQPGDLTANAQALLAQRVRQGDRQAEHELAQVYHRRVLVMMLSRVRPAETARDLTQEVMLAVLVALRKGQLRDEEKLAAFIHGTARNVLNGFYRARGPETLPLEPEHAVIGADEILDQLQSRALVARVLDCLDEDDRTVLSLILVEGLKPGEAAQRLGLSSEVVRARKSRAIKKAVERLRREQRPSPQLTE